MQFILDSWKPYQERNVAQCIFFLLFHFASTFYSFLSHFRSLQRYFSIDAKTGFFFSSDIFIVHFFLSLWHNFTTSNERIVHWFEWKERERETVIGPIDELRAHIASYYYKLWKRKKKCPCLNDCYRINSFYAQSNHILHDHIGDREGWLKNGWRKSRKMENYLGQLYNVARSLQSKRTGTVWIECFMNNAWA